MPNSHACLFFIFLFFEYLIFKINIIRFSIELVKSIYWKWVLTKRMQNLGTRGVGFYLINWWISRTSLIYHFLQNCTRSFLGHRLNSRVIWRKVFGWKRQNFRDIWWSRLRNFRIFSPKVHFYWCSLLSSRKSWSILKTNRYKRNFSFRIHSVHIHFHC